MYKWFDAHFTSGTELDLPDGKGLTIMKREGQCLWQLFRENWASWLVGGSLLSAPQELLAASRTGPRQHEKDGTATAWIAAHPNDRAMAPDPGHAYTSQSITSLTAILFEAFATPFIHRV